MPIVNVKTYQIDDNYGRYIDVSIDVRNLSFCCQDVIDIVKDQPYGSDYVKEEDPKLYVSEKTGRGPLDDMWLESYWADVEVYKLFVFFLLFLYFSQ